MKLREEIHIDDFIISTLLIIGAVFLSIIVGMNDFLNIITVSIMFVSGTIILFISIVEIDITNEKSLLIGTIILILAFSGIISMDSYIRNDYLTAIIFLSLPCYFGYTLYRKLKNRSEREDEE